MRDPSQGAGLKEEKASEMIGVLITTTGILFLVVGLIGASIEVYAQLTVGLLQQQLSEAVQQQLPGIFQEQGGEATTGEDQGLLFDPAEVLRSLIENLVSTPLWLTLTLVGLGLIYLGLYMTQRRVPRRRM
jgi:predicted PurR-regulated permease PerM